MFSYFTIQPNKIKFNVNLSFSGKMPKNPDAELDPERWLPRRERSYYRGKRRDKRKDVFKGSQGAAQVADNL